METFLAVVSKRDLREYSPEPIAEEHITRILDAGRLAGSGVNRQRWRFDVVTGEAPRAALATCVYSPHNIVSAPLVISIAIWGGLMGAFDAGRAAQNMMLTAWDLGIASCPNGFGDPGKVRVILGLAEQEEAFIALSFGYPQNPRDPSRRTPEEWIARARRRPAADVVHRHE